jgi:hypothetical protein
MLKLFFTDYGDDESLDAADARVAGKDEILHTMESVLQVPRNFVGVIDENDGTLQFMVNNDKTIRVDLPFPEDRGSYVKTCDLSECLDLVRSIRDRIKKEEIHGLKFQQW